MQIGERLHDPTVLTKPAMGLYVTALFRECGDWRRHCSTETLLDVSKPRNLWKSTDTLAERVPWTIWFDRNERKISKIKFLVFSFYFLLFFYSTAPIILDLQARKERRIKIHGCLESNDTEQLLWSIVTDAKRPISQMKSEKHCLHEYRNANSKSSNSHSRWCQSRM